MNYASLEDIFHQYYKSLYEDQPYQADPKLKEDILKLVQNKYSTTMNKILSKEIIMEELDKATRSMAKECSSRANGMGIEFYTIFWNTIGPQFTKMINLSLRIGMPPLGMTRSLITLILKMGAKEEPSN